MKPDQGAPGKPPRRSHTAPVPGMPYRLHTQPDDGASPDVGREPEFIESAPMARRFAVMERAYNPWEEQGWAGGGETPYAAPADAQLPPDAGLPPEERFFSPMPELRRKPPDPYAPPHPPDAGNAAYPPYAEPYGEPYAQPYAQPYGDRNTAPYAEPYGEPYAEPYGEPYAEPYKEPYAEPYGEPYAEPYGEPYAEPYEEPYAEPYGEPYPEGDEPAEPEAQAPPAAPPQPGKRRAEPWRIAVILSCIAGLLFCGVEIFRIAQSVAESEADIQAYRAVYLKENNVDFMRGAVAVALRPPGETYPPTPSPVPVQTPSPTPRIQQNDPLIAAMSAGSINPDQSVAPGEATPAPRSAPTGYPLNPLLVIRDDIAALRTENADIVGRLNIGGVLSELVVQRNNTYYLNHNAMGAYSGYGAVFADENVDFRVPPENIVLYARTANEGKTFAPLVQYESQGIDFAGPHAFFSFDTLYEQARYVIIAVVKTSADPASADALSYRRFTFLTDAEMLAFARDAMEMSLYNFNVSVVPTDRLLTLITLADGGDSSGLVILCRMLREGESDGVLQQDGAAP